MRRWSRPLVQIHVARSHWLSRSLPAEVPKHGGRQMFSTKAAKMSAKAKRKDLPSPIPLSEGGGEDIPLKTSWVLKLITVGTLTYVAFNAVPIMGDSLISQSLALTRAKDPFMQRSGAYRINLIATDNGRRVNIVKAGGVDAMLKLCAESTNERTRAEAAKAVANLASCDEGLEMIISVDGAKILEDLRQKTEDESCCEYCREVSVLIESKPQMEPSIGQ